jgi:hypothetical protein
MYFCNNCQNRFDDYGTKPEWVGDKIHGGIQEFRCCPICGDDDYEELTPCEQCSEPKPKDGEKYCDDCKSEVSKEISAAVQELKTRWDSELVDQALLQWVENQ